MRGTKNVLWKVTARFELDEFTSPGIIRALFQPSLLFFDDDLRIQCAGTNRTNVPMCCFIEIWLAHLFAGRAADEKWFVRVFFGHLLISVEG